jgi:hydroxyacylglutathione hydrolase
VAIEAFSDNYIWAIIQGSDAIIVDPGSAEEVIQFLQKNDLKLHAVLLTHKHADHIGGVAEILQIHTNAKVFAPEEAASLLAGIECMRVDQGSIEILGHRVEIILAPGHTVGHVMYHFSDSFELFCGDVLFRFGCGRVFEGSLEQMHQSLSIFKRLDAHTQVYCAHEYTLKNLDFALSLKPDCKRLQEKKTEMLSLRDKNCPSVPFFLEEQLQLNPMLTAQSVAEFSRVRGLRDVF